MSEQLRAPRLTNNRLNDLAVAIEILDDNIAYLADSLKSNGLNPKLHQRHTEKKAALERARMWIAGKVEAERIQRGVPA